MFERYEGESEKHFIWRVYKYRDDSGKLTNEQCGEICNKELRLNFDESRHRKIYESFLKVWNEVKDEYIEDDLTSERLDEIDKREAELYKQQVKTRDNLREYRKTLRNEARVENLKESFKEAYDNASEMTFSKYKTKHIGEKEAVLMLSDWHVGMEIKNYWNTYNSEIFEERIQTIAFKIMKYAEINNIGTLQILSLGDLLSGSIHGTTRLAEEMDVLDQVMYVAKVMKNLLCELSDFGLKIKYLSVVGNHDRVNKIFKEHIEKESFNKIVDWYICDKIEDGVLDAEYICNEIDDGIGYFVINGENCFAVHGHQDNMNNVIMNLIMATDIVPKYIFMGHYHHKVTISQGNSTVFVNGSLIGVDEYAKNKRYFAKPSQTLIVFDEDDIIDIKIKL